MHRHPSFWDRQSLVLPAGTCRPVAGTEAALPCPGPGEKLRHVGREAGIYFDTTHTVVHNNEKYPTTLISNIVVASFNNSVRFGKASSQLTQSNGRAFIFEGDAVRQPAFSYTMLATLLKILERYVSLRRHYQCDDHCGRGCWR